MRVFCLNSVTSTTTVQQIDLCGRRRRRRRWTDAAGKSVRIVRTAEPCSLLCVCAIFNAKASGGVLREVILRWARAQARHFRLRPLQNHRFYFLLHFLISFFLAFAYNELMLIGTREERDSGPVCCMTGIRYDAVTIRDRPYIALTKPPSLCPR